ncbi:MAG: response regulator [Candidatus Pacebacteria bacterium]|nr:response regulator [Candidatus Paceibacterota bacterium]
MSNQEPVKILLVEDDPFLANIYEKKFAQAGFKLDKVGAAEPALDIISKNKPDLVLLDILLPGSLDGFAVLQKIKSSPTTENILVIMLSNFSGTEEVKKAKKLGADDYIIKIELTPSEVVDKVKRILAK